MKKLLLATLTVFSFIGLTACGNTTKKLTAEEAKTEVKAVQENTAKAIEEKKALDIKAESKLKANVSAKNIKIDSSLKDLIPEIKTGKAGVDLTAKANVTIDGEAKKAKATADATAKINYDYTMGDKTEKKDWTVKGNGEAYVVDSEAKTNLYAKGNATLPDDLKEMAKIDKEAKLEGLINLAFKKSAPDTDTDEEENEDAESVISSIDFDTIIKDWTIFKKKGNTLIADCSSLTAFNIDTDVQAELAKIGLTLNVSKFEIGLNKNKEITSFDFDVNLKGTVDLAKQDIDSEDIKDFVSKIYPAAASMLDTITINGISGTVTIDTTYSLGIKIAYEASTITVPEDLTKVEEIDVNELIKAMFTPKKVVAPTEGQLQ